MTTNGPQLDAPISEAFAWPAKTIDEYEWETVLPDAMTITGQVNSRRIWHEPLGVVGAIVPWNFPFEVTSHKLGQALATGNTVILKPAPDTPWNATLLGRLIAEKTDIPAGVVNVVTPRTTWSARSSRCRPRWTASRSPARLRSASASWRRAPPP